MNSGAGGNRGGRPGDARPILPAAAAAHLARLVRRQGDAGVPAVALASHRSLGAGGHLGAGLGVVELTIALHRVFSTPHDKFVWDVSHQCYVHKILTGRKDRFHTIRTTDGLNGFALRTESEHDCYGAGHAGTALSAALGMCAARDQRNTGEHVVCIFGDAALTNGISFEALNNIASTTRRFIGILNDNEWSISQNVGALSGYLNRIMTGKFYTSFRRRVENLLKSMPHGELLARIEGMGGTLQAIEEITTGERIKAFDLDAREWTDARVTEAQTFRQATQGYYVVNERLRVSPARTLPAALFQSSSAAGTSAQLPAFKRFNALDRPRPPVLN